MAELQATYLVLKKWNHNPKLTKKEIGVWSHWKDDKMENNFPLSEKEVVDLKEIFLKNNPTEYFKLFPKADVSVETFKEKIIKNSVSAKESIKFHIKSDDYFGTLAAVLSLISQTPENNKHHIKTLEMLVQDLMYLQKEYKIVKKI